MLHSVDCIAKLHEILKFYCSMFPKWIAIMVNILGFIISIYSSIYKTNHYYLEKYAYPLIAWHVMLNCTSRGILVAYLACWALGVTIMHKTQTIYSDIVLQQQRDSKLISLLTWKRNIAFATKACKKYLATDMIQISLSAHWKYAGAGLK